MRSLQTKLTVITIAIFLVALGALGGLNYWKARTIITDNLATNISTQADNAAGDVGDWLAARKAEMAMMAVAPVVQSGTPEGIVPFLVNAAGENKVYDSLGYIGPGGAYFNSSGATGSLADRDYFRRALKGEAVISDPLVSRSTGHLVSVAAVPVKIDGKVTGVLYGAIDLESLAKKVLSVKVGQNGYAFLTQGDGLRIIHPDKEAAMKNNPLKDPNADAGQKLVSERMIKGEKGILQSAVRGTDVYYAYAPVPGINWSLGIRVPVAEVTSAVSSLTVITLGTIAVTMLVAILAITILAGRIVGPLRKIVAYVAEVADGDLTERQQTIYSRDEIGDLAANVVRMRKHLHDLVRQVSQATDHVAAATEELTAGAEQSAQAASQVAGAIGEVASGAEKQLRALDETSAGVEQLAASVGQIAVNANTVANTSAQSAEAAQAGSKAVEKAINQMGHIEETVSHSARVVGKLGERSQEIGTIIDTISGLAGQTNLLALNAAIEAARAGDQGRGFAVVAEEVRKLAEQSQQAAKKIAGLIAEIRQDTDSAIAAMNEEGKEVHIGKEVVNDAGRTFREILRLITEESAEIREILAAIQQVAGGSQQIVASVQAVNAVSKDTASHAQSVSAATEEQSAAMEEIAASSQSLARMAEELTQAVSRFRV